MAEKTTRSDKVKKLALNIDAAEEIGMLEISSTQAKRVSIIRSRGRKRVNDLWKPKASVWIPVEHTGAIAEFLARAEKKIHEDT